MELRVEVGGVEWKWVELKVEVGGVKSGSGWS